MGGSRAVALQAPELWTPRADAAILEVSLAWRALLDGLLAFSAVRLQHG
ncbi:MAG: hypothetical protein ACKVZ0_20650 [Gemmatimonadales bacterium]